VAKIGGLLSEPFILEVLLKLLELLMLLVFGLDILVTFSVKLILDIQIILKKSQKIEFRLFIFDISVKKFNIIF